MSEKQKFQLGDEVEAVLQGTIRGVEQRCFSNGGEIFWRTYYLIEAECSPINMMARVDESRICLMDSGDMII